jgi:hypothetical protein
VSASSAARLIVERNELLTERFDSAASIGALEWIAAVVQEKELLVALMRTLRSDRSGSDGELVGRLYAALELLDEDVIDVGSVQSVIRGAIRAAEGL